MLPTFTQKKKSKKGCIENKLTFKTTQEYRENPVPY